MRDDLLQMRQFIEAADDYTKSSAAYLVEGYQEPMKDEAPVENPNVPLLADLNDVVFKLRAFMESTGNDDFALGVETGMQKAADMIENIIRRHVNGDEGAILRG